MMRLWRHLFALSPWHRGYGAGWDDAVETLARFVEDVIPERRRSTVSASELHELAAMIRREAEH